MIPQPMGPTDTISALEIHSRAEAEKAKLCEAKAQAARDFAADQAKLHAGLEAKVRRDKIIADGEIEAAKHDAEAQQHARRASTAKAGYLLHGPDERGDSQYALTHQGLISACAKHGLCKSEPC